MSLLWRRRRIEIWDPYSYYVPSSSTVFFNSEALSFPPLLLEVVYDDGFCGATFDLFSNLKSTTPFDLFESVTDLIELQKTPPSLSSSYRRILRHSSGAHSNLLTLYDRVSALESQFDRLAVNAKSIGDRKYPWTTEIRGKDAERKYKFTAEFEGGGKEEEKHHHHHHLEHKKGGKKNYKWTAEIKEKGDEGPIKQTYTWQASTGGDPDADDGSDSGKKHKKEKKDKGKKHKEKKEKYATTRTVEIEEPSNHGAVVLRHAFATRAGALRAAKGKKKEQSPQDAALLIQMSFKAYLVHRSRALRALRELTVVKSKIKEIRTLFHNFSYRRRIVHDAEERQRFSERIIVLLFTVDAIEGIDLMVRASKKSMVDKLEAMLDVVDPQPPSGKSLSMKRRRTFDVPPDGVIQKEIAEGVTHTVRMLEEEEEEEDSASE